MQLVGQYDSPYVRRAAVSLLLLGMLFERNTMSVFADAEEMRRINPLVRIPSLILDDGEVLVDSGAILDHIDETVGAERAPGSTAASCSSPARSPPSRRCRSPRGSWGSGSCSPTSRLRRCWAT